MLETLKTRKEELEKRGKKGFTLMEMLIVIAIIAVLVAIAIPIFTAQLEKSKEATDMANIRSAYAEVTTAYLSDTAAHAATVNLQSNTTDWKSDPNAKIAGVKASEVIGSDTSAQTTIDVTVSASGVVKIGEKEATSSQLTS